MSSCGFVSWVWLEHGWATLVMLEGGAPGYNEDYEGLLKAF